MRATSANSKSKKILAKDTPANQNRLKEEILSANDSAALAS